MRPTACATLLALCALAASARADEVVTKTGKTYTGTIVAEDKDTVTVDTPTLGQMKVARVDIARINKTQTPAKDAAAKPAAAKPADEKKNDAAPAAAPESPDKAAADDAAKAKAKTDADAAAKAKAEAEEILSAQERDRRRRATRIVRRTDPAAAKPAPAAAKTPTPEKEEEAKATLSGAQLARVERGSWIVVVQPPKQVEGASGAIAIGRRTYARLESVGAASASMTIPMAAGDERVAIRLADVQRHALVKADASRVSRMIDGIEPGSWLRARLSDGTTVEGVLQEVKDASLTLGRVEDDGTIVPFDVASGRLVEVDGLMRSNATRMTLAEVVIGEPFAATMWPDAKLVAGTVTERSDTCITLRTSRGATERVCADGPVAEARRVPLKWRQAVTSIGPKTLARVGCSEEYPDAHVERDLAGVVLAASAFAVTLDTPDGVIVVPYEAVIRLEMSDSGSDDSKPMKKSDRSCSVPVLPGDPASKTQGLDAASGVSAVTDGDVVRHVIVSRPFDGSVFGVRLGDRAVDAQDATDIRFDTVVVPRKKIGAEERPAEMTSNSLESMRVTLLLDAAGSVSAIELTSR